MKHVTCKPVHTNVHGINFPPTIYFFFEHYSIAVKHISEIIVDCMILLTCQ